MPQRAFHLLGWSLLVVGLVGCSHWPSQEHRDVTLDSIGKVVHERTTAIACDVNGLSDQLQAQSTQIDELAKQVQGLRAANPTFAQASCPPSAPSTRYDDRIIVGSTEWVYLTPPGEYFLARVDSGATTSSVSAQNITPFERNGKKWVRFFIAHSDDGSGVEVEAPLLRTAVIRQASTEDSVRRSVVMLTVNLGSIQQDAEFTLTDRSQMTYPMLLGREFLQDIVLIDVGRQNVQPKFVPDETNQPKNKAGARIAVPVETVPEKSAEKSSGQPVSEKVEQKQQETVNQKPAKALDKVNESPSKSVAPE